PAPNYVNQFGPFWYEVFATLTLYSVYSAWWFLLILAVLVTSTSLCIARNLPKIRSDLKTYKEDLQERSLRSFHHKAEVELAEPLTQVVQRVSRQLRVRGWRLKLQDRTTPDGAAVMVAGRIGSANKLGYLAAHGAIVLICLGGLFDGEMLLKLYMAATGKAPTRENFPLSAVPPQHLLPQGNPSYRGNVFVPEGGESRNAVINFSNGVMVQPLPFTIKLDKFVVDYYSTGMPKLFASDVELTDPRSGKTLKGRIEVNKPLSFDGVTIFQSSFDDGGSALKLKVWPMQGAGAQAFNLDGQVGGSTEIGNGKDKLTVEYTGLRVINVENMGDASGAATDVRKVDLRHTIEAQLGSGAGDGKKVLRNVGPSITYRLRDASGQAREFSNYMLPVELDGVKVFLSGVRSTAGDAMRYMRIPADENDSIDGFMRLRAALADPALRARAVDRLVGQAASGSTAAAHMGEQLRFSASRALDLFAGAVPVVKGKPAVGGLEAVAEFLQTSVPPADRTNASDVFMRLLNAAIWNLNDVSREAAGLKALPQDEKSQRYVSQAMLALSDSFVYGAPVYLKLDDFKQVQASVFQVARAPGRYLVYLGCVFLITGVFAMLYIRERRIWVLLKSHGDATQLVMALSTTRKTLDFEREHAELSRLVGAGAAAAKE
ncbi:MAG: cytochrome c biogenesis protein ResB, partial [Betaproteobacteria bacterium]|nr:cytochrome c biogenesis protein ResB [Betaproteobacteria bacterium]